MSGQRPFQFHQHSSSQPLSLDVNTLRSPYDVSTGHPTGQPTHSTPTSPRLPAHSSGHNRTVSSNGDNPGSPVTRRVASPHPRQFGTQSRQAKSPSAQAYIPAVLRPPGHSLRLAKSGSTTSVRLLNGHAHGDSQEKDDINLDSKTMEDTTDGLEQDVLDMKRNGKMNFSAEAEEEWKRYERVGEVTGPPTQEHWKVWFSVFYLTLFMQTVGSPVRFFFFFLFSQADAISSTCDFLACRSAFNVFKRRHHCRHCGHVFCASHTTFFVPLDQNARFHIDGEPSRACDMCWRAYRKWEVARLKKLIVIEKDLEAERRTQREARENAQTPSGEPESQNRPISQRTDSSDSGSTGIPQSSLRMAGSVPRDWMWSTF